MLITNFRWRNWEPEMVVFENEETIIPLMNQHVDFRLGERHCIGYTKGGKSFDCPDTRIVASGRQCELCRSLDDNLPCIQCMGLCTNAKERKKCMNDSFSIYIAAFGPLLKVGISREFRLKQRLVEQGADFGAKISTMKDGRMIRIYEQRIRRFLGITDRVMGSQKHANFISDPRECIKGINTSLKMLSSSPLSEIMNGTEIFDMRPHYNLVDAKPVFTQVEKGLEICGNVVSVKGNMIVIENGVHRCIDGHALIGREIFVKTIEN